MLLLILPVGGLVLYVSLVYGLGKAIMEAIAARNWVGAVFGLAFLGLILWLGVLFLEHVWGPSGSGP